MRRSHSHAICAALALLATAATAVLAAEQRTGTHLNSRAAANPGVLHLSRPGEIDEILRLIEAGRTADAVELAREHVDELRDTSLENKEMSDSALYFAMNALCVALTTDGQTVAALQQCGEAIAMAPKRWSAWNSRGTAHFSRRDFPAALADFEQALDLLPPEHSAAATVGRNIQLARQRLDN